MWPNDHIARRMCEIAVAFEHLGPAAAGSCGSGRNEGRVDGRREEG
jgi:hypothetical protein